MINFSGKNKKKELKRTHQARSAFSCLLSFNQKGMSFMELIIVIAIIGIGSSVAIVSFIPARTQSKLKAAQTELAANIKLAQSYALQGKSVGSPASTPKKFGLKTASDGKSYDIFYCSDANCPNKTSMESFPLFSSFGVTVSSDMEVSFDVPHGNPSNNNNLIFTLDFSGATPKTVTVTSGGSITEN